MKLIIYFLIGIFCTVVGDDSVKIKPHDLTISLNCHKNITVSLTNPLNRTFYVNFKYDPSGIIEHLEPNRTFLPGDVGPLVYVLKAHKPSKGFLAIVSHKDNIDLSGAYVRLKINRVDALDLVSTIIGWMYFVAWSVSFYPQIYLNWSSKSVIGLDFNYLTLNIVGFFCYSVYNIALFSSKTIQALYFNQNSHAINPVHFNDIFFSVHAFLISTITGVQCLIYERGEQKVMNIFKIIHVFILLFLIISVILATTSVINYLLLIYFFSYVKLGITIIKYIPQATFNCMRRSTSGWSIGNVLLDFTGGSLSMLQMFIDAYNYDSWSILFGDITKFGLGLFSVLFDVLFIIQHYVLFRNKDSYENVASSKKNDDSTDRLDFIA